MSIQKCQFGQCDADATVSLPGYASECSTARGTEWYCDECYQQRVAELTERALARSCGGIDAERDELVALDVHLDRLGLGAAELEYTDADGYTGRAVIGDVVLTATTAISVLRDLHAQTSDDDVWAALDQAASSAAEQLRDFTAVSSDELDRLPPAGEAKLGAELERIGRDCDAAGPCDSLAVNSERGDDDSKTGRVLLSDDGGSVALEYDHALAVLAGLADDVSHDDLWQALSAAEAREAEARRVGGTVRWHRASRRPVVAVKVGGRWMARLR
jgi:hypothetical protein